MTNKKGFTLAEVLITLGIIGVVAAITLPTMMQDGKKQQLGTKLAKFQNNIEAAVRPVLIEDNQAFTNSTELGNYLKDEMIYDSTSSTTNGEKYNLRDGTTVEIITATTTPTAHNSGRFGVSASMQQLVFIPNINGLDGQTSFTFVVTEKGFVVPSNSDSCLIDIANNKWRASKVYKTGTSDHCKKPAST